MVGSSRQEQARGDDERKINGMSRSRELIEEFLTRRGSDESLTFDEFCSEFPELEEELRGLFVKYDDQSRRTSAATHERAGSSLTGNPPHKLGDFTVVREIGRGGMGIVFEAEQHSLRRRVALKILPAHLSFSKEAVLKFRREAEAGGRQSHPGIVQVHAVGEDQGIHFIALELVEGGKTLSDQLEVARKRGVQPRGYFRGVARFVSEIADALQAAHDRGVIHRDVKPSNILITGDGRPKMTDFGLAKLEDAISLSRTGDFAGTPYYMSPEQAMSRRMGIDSRTDVFSLGVTLYEMLTLARPFEGKTSQEVLKKILLSEPRNPSKANTSVPRDLAVISLKAIEKDPNNRYATMQALNEDLNRFLSGDVILAKPAWWWRRVLSRVKRSSAVSSTVGVAFLAMSMFFRYLVAKREVSERTEELRLYADGKNLSHLRGEAEALWPALPDMVPELESWLKQARALTGRLDFYRKSLRALRARALPYDAEARDRDRANHPLHAELRSLEAERSKLQQRIGEISDAGIGRGDDERSVARGRVSRSLEAQVALLDDQITGLENQISRRWTWAFDEEADQLRHGVLQELVDGLEALSDARQGLIRSVEERLAFARTVVELSIHYNAEAWDQAIASIADEQECPFYRGLRLRPQVGLIPIGRDPATGLWEFAHLQTGTPPRRDSSGELILTEEYGLVFVLIPPGEFSMGAARPEERAEAAARANLDPAAEPFEGPVHMVQIEAFLLSKYEMTQGQWFRITKENPSAFQPGIRFGNKEHTLLHPVEQVSWQDSVRVMSWLELRLPSEAEWEYAARAGSPTVWWTGDEKESLAGAANLADRFCRENKGPSSLPYEQWLDDGYTTHAPVHSFQPNPFGLFNIHGNVSEWCQDAFHEDYGVAPSDGTAWETWGEWNRVHRGGSWYDCAARCRSAIRHMGGADHRTGRIGLRPAAVLPRASN